MACRDSTGPYAEREKYGSRSLVPNLAEAQTSAAFKEQDPSLAAASADAGSRSHDRDRALAPAMLFTHLGLPVWDEHYPKAATSFIHYSEAESFLPLHRQVLPPRSPEGEPGKNAKAAGIYCKKTAIQIRNGEARIPIAETKNTKTHLHTSDALKTNTHVSTCKNLVSWKADIHRCPSLEIMDTRNSNRSSCSPI